MSQIVHFSPNFEMKFEKMFELPPPILSFGGCWLFGISEPSFPVRKNTTSEPLMVSLDRLLGSNSCKSGGSKPTKTPADSGFALSSLEV